MSDQAQTLQRTVVFFKLQESAEEELDASSHDNDDGNSLFQPPPAVSIRRHLKIRNRSPGDGEFEEF
jgi:hypothetical protein